MTIRSTFARAFHLLQWLLILAVLCGWLARHVDPRTPLWWFQLIAIPLPYTGLMLVGSFGLSLFQRRVRWRRVWIGVHVLLLLLLAWRFVPRPEGEGEGAQATLLSYNIGPQYGWQRDTTSAQLIQLALTERPDLIALQEAWMGHETDEVTPFMAVYYRALVDSLGYAVARSDTIPAVRVSTEPILSTLPVRALWHAQYDAFDAGARSGVTRTEVLHEGRIFVLYNIHLRTHGEAKPWHAGEPWDTDSTSTKTERWKRFVTGMRDAYRARAYDTDRILRRLREEEHPVVIAGDLNSTPHDWVYARLSSGRRDAFASVGDGWGSTYHARLPFARIDYVLTDPDLIVERAEVLPALLSDHRPLLVSLRWREGAATPPLPQFQIAEPAPVAPDSRDAASPEPSAVSHEAEADTAQAAPERAAGASAVPGNDEARH